jgi:hypothetical protein
MEIAAKMVAEKVLKKHFNAAAWRRMVSSVPKQKLVRIRNSTRMDFAGLFLERLYNCSAGEIKYVAISCARQVSDPQFNITIEMLVDKLIKEDRSVTFRFYMLDPNSPAFDEFAKLSDESIDGLRAKYDQTIILLRGLINERSRKRIRIRVYAYSALPILNFFQVDGDYFFRAYKIGKKQGQFDVLHTVGDDEGNEMTMMLKNLLADMGFRSRQEDINWF